MEPWGRLKASGLRLGFLELAFGLAPLKENTSTTRLSDAAKNCTMKWTCGKPEAHLSMEAHHHLAPPFCQVRRHKCKERLPSVLRDAMVSQQHSSRPNPVERSLLPTPWQRLPQRPPSPADRLPHWLCALGILPLLLPGLLQALGISNSSPLVRVNKIKDAAILSRELAMKNLRSSFFNWRIGFPP